MDYGDKRPAHLYNLNVLRQAGHEAKNEKLGLKPSTNLFDSILNLKKDVEFHMSIRDVGFDKFHVFFWSRRVRLDTLQLDTSQSQRLVSRNFLLFKRCEWLVSNCNVTKRTLPPLIS